MAERVPDVPGDAFELARRILRPGEPFVFFDGDAAPREARTAAERALRQWSFIAAMPTGGLCVRGGESWTYASGAWSRTAGDPWALLRALVPPGPPDPEAPFPHGLAGLVAYDAGRLIERIPDRARDDTHLPDLLFYRFDAVVAIPAGESPRFRHAPGAREAAAALMARAETSTRVAADEGTVAPMRAAMSPKAFEQMVLDAQDHVRAGDVFQVNLSHRLETETTLAPFALYSRLREANPAPFSAFFASGALPWMPRGFDVISSSPERLFKLQGGRLEARPIAGTRKRGKTPAEDASLVAELRGDAKEQAEHVMLVDLARNDLGRVARFGSVHVPDLLTVETYKTVHHLVSVVEADLAPDKDVVDALRALFPGGTITGAPKVRAMEIIERLEPTRRGVYTGSLGWIGPGGDADLNILIRTLLHQDGRIHLQVGAGIVEESVPAREYAETLAKAKGLLRALGADEDAP